MAYHEIPDDFWNQVEPLLEPFKPARRWVVERTIAWIKGFRAIRTRYFCKAQNYLAMIHLACALIVSRKLETV